MLTSVVQIVSIEGIKHARSKEWSIRPIHIVTDGYCNLQYLCTSVSLAAQRSRWCLDIHYCFPDCPSLSHPNAWYGGASWCDVSSQMCCPPLNKWCHNHNSLHWDRVYMQLDPSYRDGYHDGTLWRHSTLLIGPSYLMILACIGSTWFLH